MSAVDPQNGFPTWYSDGTVKLQLCYMAGAGCLSEPPNPDAPASYPENFPEEAFWFNAEASGGNLSLYEAALEGAHLNGQVVPGEQMGFGRLRFIVDNLRPGARYTIRHPYGENTFVSEQDPKNTTRGRIKQTIDAGVCTPSPRVPCDWAGVGEAFLGGDAATTTSTFLRQIGAPAGTLGDINTPRPVTGAPSGHNAVTISGPDAGGPGVDTLTISQFTVQGLVYDAPDAAPSTPDLTATSDSGRSTTDNVTNVVAPTFAGTVPGIGASEASVQLVVDGSTTPAAEGATLNGVYSIALPTELAGGVHRVVARTPNPAYQLDETGSPVDPTVPQFLTSGTLTFTVDTTPPPVSIVAPKPSNPSAVNTPTVGFSIGEAGATAECQLLPSNPDWDPCVSPASYDAQLDGSYTFSVRATDAAGNVGTPAAYTWRIGPPDTTPPTVVTQSPQANATGVPLANGVTVRFSEAVTGVSGASIVLDDPQGVPVAATVTYNPTTLTATLRPTASLASGTRYTLSVSNAIQDVSGNAYAGSTSTFTTADTIAPTVTSRTPASDATGVATTAVVTATFSEPVTDVSATSFVLVDPAGSAVPAAVTYSPATRTATLDPAEELAPGTTFTAEVSSGVTDASGNPLTPATWTFTTAVDTTAPSVSARTPAVNATGVSQTGNITATLSEPVTGVGATTFTLKNAATGAAVGATSVTYNSTTRVATFDPNVTLAADTKYTASLTTAIKDRAGLALPATGWTFTTGPVPTVSARTPGTNATGVSRTGNLTVTFSERVTGAGATTFTLKKTATGAAVGATSVTYNATTRAATFDPNVTLAADTKYTATLGTGVKDTAGNPLAATTWTFTTGPVPTVSARTPANGATGVSRTANITATFSEPVTGVGPTSFTLKNATSGAAIGATSVTYNATTRVATFDPNVTLAADTKYTATLTTGVRDTGGNPVAATTWTFTTGPAPTVTGRTPAANATKVGRTANISATFGEAVTGVAATTFRLKNAATGAAVAGTVSRNGTTNQWILNPGVTLAATTKYTVTLTGGAGAIRDTGGNPLATTSWSFTTGTA
ncbi:MAG TPA: Ig-like domain-containing protein [Actinomycetales bacterium]|nr:Ig-like domain-containing protein [Actinomycetales bacterium]